jgi:hypothetical protein
VVPRERLRVPTSGRERRYPGDIGGRTGKEHAAGRRREPGRHRAREHRPAEHEKPQEDRQEERLREDRGGEAQQDTASRRGPSEDRHRHRSHEQDIRVAEHDVVQERERADEPDDRKEPVQRSPPGCQRAHRHDGQHDLEGGVEQADRERVDGRKGAAHDRSERWIEELRVRVERLA